MSDWMPEPGTAQEGDAEHGAAAQPDVPPAPSFDPAPPAPLGVARAATGHPGVDAQLERLADADHLPADGHTAVYEDVHRGLRDALTALDAGPAPAPPYDNRS
ncbi:hypothetical protein ABZS61_05250 [Streptomyces sp. NPDC005566]|uniref:hypothetical protein n=1 Tax=Streptomyces sp. NPDC005566 TaxID=3156886 RepID=UPI0033A33164